MIILRTNKPIANRDDVWESQVNAMTLSPTRRDKLVNLLNLAGFVLRTDAEDWQAGEIRDMGSLYILET